VEAALIHADRQADIFRDYANTPANVLVSKLGAKFIALTAEQRLSEQLHHTPVLSPPLRKAYLTATKRLAGVLPSLKHNPLGEKRPEREANAEVNPVKNSSNT
jgi:hypothetical protein